LQNWHVLNLTTSKCATFSYVIDFTSTCQNATTTTKPIGMMFRKVTAFECGLDELTAIEDRIGSREGEII